MDLNLNVSKKGLSTTEEVINEEYTLRYGHIFRGKSAYQYAVESGLFNGSEEAFAEYLGNVGNLSEEAKLAIVEAKEAAKNANEMANTADTAAGNADNATISANDATKKAEAATTATTTAIAEANSAATDARTATTRANTATERANAAAANAEQYEEKLDAKQDGLVSGENIKTINGESILGEGNIIITNYPSTNEIWYYTNGQIPAQEFDGVFDANIISHEYSNNRGVLKFNREVTRINSTFPYAHSVFLPASITYIEDFAFGGIDTVYVNAPNPPSIGGDYSFGAAVYVPINSFDKYESEWEENMNGWHIKGIVFPDEFVVIDTEISETSTNAVTNKAVAKALQEKVSNEEGKGLSANDFTDEYKQKVEEFIIDTGLSSTSNNAIANSAVVNGLAGFAEGVSAAIGQVSEQLGAEIETKADKRGYYPDMTVGKADNLVGRGDTQDATINFRPSGGVPDVGNGMNITDGTARIKAIKGNSVVYNQVMPTTNATISASPISSIRENGIVTCNGTTLPTGSGGIPLGQFVANEVGHKYLFICNIISNEGDSVEGKMFNLSNRSVFSDSKYIQNGFASFVHENTQAESSKGRGTTIIAGNDFVANLKVRVRQIDLTQMFGAGNEPTSYEEYLQRKPINIADEFAYNEGELVDMKVNSLVSVGDNAWDEEWENGTFNTTTGANIDTSKTQIRSKNLIKVLPNTNYTCTIPAKLGNDGIWCMLLDKDKKVITDYMPTPSKSGNSFGLRYDYPSFTTPANAAYLKFYCPAIYGDVYTNDICFHLEQSGYKNGKYYPYRQEVKDLSFISEAFPEGMRSAGSAFDEIRYNVTTKKWEAVKRVGDRVYQDEDENDSNLTTDGATTNYPLATPIEVEIPNSENWNLDYLVWDFGTELALVRGSNIDNLIPSAPFRADINYEPNAVDDLRWSIKYIRALEQRVFALEQKVVQETNIEEA